MAKPNTLEVRLTFKPMMDGLNKFMAGFQQRMRQVQAFNVQIQNGAQTVNRALGQIGAVLGVAALARYASAAREADKVQQQLIRSLERTGQTGALAALNEQAGALQKLTLFSSQAVTTVQRLLVTYGLTARQAKEMTELVMDFAQETGQSAEAAAMLIGRTLAGESDELGRYKIHLDQTKGKVDALGDALRRFAAGAARGAVADPAQRAIESRYAVATENLGRAVNRLAVPFLEALIPLLERVADAAERVAAQITPFAPLLGALAHTVLPVVAGFGALKLAMTAAMLVINPLRVAIVALSGQTLLELNNRLAAVAARFGATRTAAILLKDGFTSLAGAGRLLAVAGSIAGAALAGWSLGKLINEIEVSGMKIKDWAATIIVIVQDKLGAAWASLQKAWLSVRSDWDSLQLHIRATALQMAITVAEAFNRISPKKIDTSGWHFALARLQADIAGLDAKERAARAAIGERRAEQRRANAELVEFIRQTSSNTEVNTPAASADTAAGRGDLNDQRFGRRDETAVQRLREIFELETQIVQAQLRGNQPEIDRLQRRRAELQLGHELNELGEDAQRMIEQRLNLEDELRDRRRSRVEAERSLSEQLGDLAIRRADIESNRYRTTEEKQRAILPLLQEEALLLKERIALLEHELLLGVDDSRRGDILTALDRLRQQQAANRGAIAEAEPQGILDGLRQGIVGQGGFLDQLGTAAQTAANTIRGTLQTAVDGISEGIYGWITRTQTWKESLIQIAGSVLQQVIRGVTQIVIQELILERVRDMIQSRRQAKEKQEMATKATAAGLESVKQLGPIAGPIAFAASLAAIMAAVGSFGGFRAHGGDAKAGKAYVVGDGGVPEVFVPGSDGYIFPSLSALPEYVDGSMARPTPAGHSGQAANRGWSSSYDQAQHELGEVMRELAGRITVVVVDSEREAKRIDRHSQARNDIVRIVREEQAAILRRGA